MLWAPKEVHFGQNGSVFIGVMYVYLQQLVFPEKPGKNQALRRQWGLESGEHSTWESGNHAHLSLLL